MDTVHDLLKQSEKLFEDAKAILIDPEADAEKRGHVPEMLEDAKSIKARAMQLKEVEDALTEGAQLNRKYAVAEKDKERKNQRPGQFKNFGEFLEAVSHAGDVGLAHAIGSDDPPQQILCRVQDRVRVIRGDSGRAADPTANAHRTFLPSNGPGNKKERGA